MNKIDWGDLVAKELRRAASRPRKHASFFQWHKKNVMELQLCSRLVSHLEKTGESGFTKITEGGDPPDCVITKEEKDFAVEVTELVVQESIEEQLNNNLAYVIGPEWTESYLMEKLNSILEKKDSPLNKPDLRSKYDRYTLLIHTDEPELDINNFNNIMNKEKLIHTSLIDEVYVVFSYDPRLKYEPVVRIKQ